MIAKTLTAFALVYAVASPAFASTQLHRDFDISGLTLSEIVKLKNARENDNRNLVRVIRNGQAVFVRVN